MSVVSVLDGDLLEVRCARDVLAGDVLHEFGGRRVVHSVEGSGSWRRIVCLTISGKYRFRREVLAAHEFIAEPRQRGPA